MRRPSITRTCTEAPPRSVSTARSLIRARLSAQQPEVAHAVADVDLGLVDRRHAAVLLDGARAGVVRGQDELRAGADYALQVGHERGGRVDRVACAVDRDD